MRVRVRGEGEGNRGRGRVGARVRVGVRVGVRVRVGSGRASRIRSCNAGTHRWRAASTIWLSSGTTTWLVCPERTARWKDLSST